MLVHVTVGRANAEYMSICNLGAMKCHLICLTCELEYLGNPEKNIEERTRDGTNVILIDN